jgi:hypothetical protein
MERPGQVHPGYLLIKSLGGPIVVLKAMGENFAIEVTILPYRDTQSCQTNGWSLFKVSPFENSFSKEQLLLHRGSLWYILLAKH